MHFHYSDLFENLVENGVLEVLEPLFYIENLCVLLCPNNIIFRMFVNGNIFHQGIGKLEFICSRLECKQSSKFEFKQYFMIDD